MEGGGVPPLERAAPGRQELINDQKHAGLCHLSAAGFPESIMNESWLCTLCKLCHTNVDSAVAPAADRTICPPPPVCVCCGTVCVPQGKRCLVSGSGNVAQYAALKLLEYDAVVLTMSDSTGYVYEPNGFSKEQIEQVGLTHRINVCVCGGGL